VACGGYRLERSELPGGNRGLAGLPDRRDPDRVEAGRLGQLHLRHRDGRVGVAALILRRAHVHPLTPERLGGGQGQGRESAEQCYEGSTLWQKRDPKASAWRTPGAAASVGTRPEGVNPNPPW